MSLFLVFLISLPQLIVTCVSAFTGPSRLLSYCGDSGSVASLHVINILPARHGDSIGEFLVSLSCCLSLTERWLEGGDLLLGLLSTLSLASSGSELR